MSIFSTIHVCKCGTYCPLLHLLESGPLGCKWMHFDLALPKIVNAAHTVHCCMPYLLESRPQPDLCMPNLISVMPVIQVVKCVLWVRTQSPLFFQRPSRLACAMCFKLTVMPWHWDWVFRQLQSRAWESMNATLSEQKQGMNWNRNSKENTFHVPVPPSRWASSNSLHLSHHPTSCYNEMLIQNTCQGAAGCQCCSRRLCCQVC